MRLYVHPIEAVKLRSTHRPQPVSAPYCHSSARNQEGDRKADPREPRCGRIRTLKHGHDSGHEPRRSRHRLVPDLEEGSAQRPITGGVSLTPEAALEVRLVGVAKRYVPENMSR